MISVVAIFLSLVYQFRNAIKLSLLFEAVPRHRGGLIALYYGTPGFMASWG
jgi:hypothetical protein